MKQEKLYSLIPLDEFKTILNLDDRDDKLSRFCLVTATHTIEQFCHRRLLVKKYFEDLPFFGDLVLPLSHYPVCQILVLYEMRKWESCIRDGEIIGKKFYRVIPDIAERCDTPAYLVLSPVVRPLRGEKSLKIVYKAGYSARKVPSDLASACLELAAWNMSRYKGKRIGISGKKNDALFEISMPENVKALLEEYRRKTI